MGQVVRSGAGVDRIAGIVEETSVRATAHGGDIAAAAASRLSSPLAAMAVALAAVAPARVALQAARATLQVAADAAVNLVGLVHDAVRNALGRPARHDVLESVFPEGVRTYVAAPPAELPMFLQLFLSRLEDVAAPPWSAAQMVEWTAQVGAARAALVAALASVADAGAVHRLARSVYASKVRTGLRGLVALKRDLRTMGLAEAQVTEIIPDATPRRPDRAAAPPDATSAPPALVPPAAPSASPADALQLGPSST